MTQETFNVIVKVLVGGAPAIANELINEIVKLQQENEKLQQKVNESEDKKDGK